MRRILGVNTWVWTSPVTDASLPAIAAKAADLGFGAIELPIEQPGDWDPHRARDVLAEHRLRAYVVGAMAPGRNLVAAPASEIVRTQNYLARCITAAAVLGSPIVAGPFTAATGRTWRMTDTDRAEAYDSLRASLTPVVARAEREGVRLAIEPLNRYETSLINTVDQALDALEPLLGPALGIALDSYHLNIEEKDVAAAVRTAGRHIAHVQVCGTDRGAVGDDHADWPGFLDALDDAGYTGPLNLESFTSDNDTIATAASIWRPLAASQDALAARTFDYLTRLQNDREDHR
ncbi:sugar phosphate isomerase/epimerase [Diaminobutyricimonas sp. LJ205]|uniref:sugar phosphate isomerase/epimerase family protein n=1 Tax=Diaminobutyricimonas sp. LJ205 TaxID=2683590 RepID=UPI0012F484F7|nr:sugar phosphate isomerase/epimerase family protein [Diaminobutyricimonas sp. LJ205]